MGRHIHFLSQIDLKKKKAVCSNCGEVGIHICDKKHKKCRCKIAWTKAHQKAIWKHKYGIILPDELPEKPKECPICKKEKKLVLDHDHKTGKIRGWLCNNCNNVIGQANDDIKILESSIQYLSS
jgi:hypothetical protein